MPERPRSFATARAAEGANSSDPGHGPEPVDGRLGEFLSEAVCVVGADGRIRAALGAPGVLGTGNPIGTALVDHLHPDDRPAEPERALEALSRAPDGQACGPIRLRHAGGGYRSYDVAVVDRRDDPALAGFVVRLRQVLPAAEREPRRLELDLDALADALPVPVLFFDEVGRASFANAAARKLLGDHLEAATRGGLLALCPPDERGEVRAALEALEAAPGDATLTMHLDPHGASPAAPLLEVHLSARARATGTPSLVAALEDVTDRHHTEHELRRQASSDPLTGLLNRRGAEAVLRERIRRGAEHVALVYLDLDRFKVVNDTYGHDAGDAVLVEAARTLRAGTRAEDAVARFGGDEFLVIVDQDEARDLDALARRLEAAIGAAVGYGVSASAGVARGRRGDSPRSLVRRADRAMYAEKRRRGIATVGGDLLARATRP